jgi:hypothetical protein
MRDNSIITEADRELLAQAYEEIGGAGPYPTYAEIARSGSGDFTLCTLRAIARARLASKRTT